MRIDVSGRIFAFPHKCACCCAPPDTELSISASRTWGSKVVHTETKSWGVPYCSDCIKHLRSMKAAYAFASWFTVFTVLLGVLIGFRVDLYWGISTGILALISTIAVFGMKLRDARAECGPNCAGANAAIAYLGWSGTLHSFEINSQRFAGDFMTANQRKLVNLTPEARALLSSSSPAPTPNVSRSPGRRIS